MRVPLSVFLHEFAGWLNLNKRAQAAYKDRQRRRALALETALEKRRVRSDLTAAAATAEEEMGTVHVRGALCDGLYSCADDTPVGAAVGIARSTKGKDVATQVAAVSVAERSQRVSMAVGAATETKGAMAFLIGQAAAASRAKVRQQEREQQRLHQEGCVQQECVEQGATGSAAPGGAASDEPPASCAPPQQQTPPPSPPSPSSSAPQADHGRGVFSRSVPSVEVNRSSALLIVNALINALIDDELGERDASAVLGANAVVPPVAGELKQSTGDCSQSAEIGEAMEEEELPASNASSVARPKPPWGAPRSFATEPLQPTGCQRQCQRHMKSPHWCRLGPPTALLLLLMMAQA